MLEQQLPKIKPTERNILLNSIEELTGDESRETFKTYNIGYVIKLTVMSAMGGFLMG